MLYEVITDEDTGLSYMHDLGFIAKIENGVRGFKVMLGGGLGSQPRHADELYSFLPSDKIIPVMEGVLRIFDRHGERKSRANRITSYNVCYTKLLRYSKHFYNSYNEKTNVIPAA